MYINCVNRAHGWDEPDLDEIKSKPTSPLPEKCLSYIFDECGPVKGTSEYKALQKQMGFAYHTLLGELLYAYVTYCLDIGFASMLMAKIFANPAEKHYKHLKMICTYLRQTKHWGIQYKMNLSNGPPSIPLPEGGFSNLPMPLPEELPDFPTLPNGPTITCFCDAAFRNIKPKLKSKTGYTIFLAGTAIVY